MGTDRATAPSVSARARTNPVSDTMVIEVGSQGLPTAEPF